MSKDIRLNWKRLWFYWIRTCSNNAPNGRLWYNKSSPTSCQTGSGWESDSSNSSHIFSSSGMKVLGSKADSDWDQKGILIWDLMGQVVQYVWMISGWFLDDFWMIFGWFLDDFCESEIVSWCVLWDREIKNFKESNIRQHVLTQTLCFPGYSE